MSHCICGTVEVGGRFVTGPPDFECPVHGTAEILEHNRKHFGCLKCGGFPEAPQHDDENLNWHEYERPAPQESK